MIESIKERIPRFALFVSGSLAALTIAAILCLLASTLSCRQSDRSAARAALTATDDLGHVVSLPQNPKRIVSLAPNITEILFALGLDSAVAGVTDYCDYPEAARSKPRIGGMLNPNLERVLELHPDLVLMSGSGNMKSDYEKLTSSGVAVFVTYPRTIDNVFTSIVTIGALVGRKAEADSIVQALESRKRELLRQAQGVPRQSVLMLLSLRPIVAIGPGTFLHELLTIANAENIAGNAAVAYPVLSREEILRRQPDVIIATNDIVRSTDDILKAYPEWKSLRAVQKKRVALVDASIVSRPGPRVIEGLRTILQAIHPAEVMN
jgi:iron complex transport system substrate-binding protein